MSDVKYNIIFAGTPDFALPSLLACIESKHNVCAVYSQPDKPRGRGQELSPSPVKKLAVEHNIPVHTPLNFKDPAAVAELKKYSPDLIVVVAYGMILPQEVLDVPKITCLNVHSSLLPRWRGAAPINRAIMAGDTETGVSIMQVVKELDAGAVYKQDKIKIKANDTASSLHDSLAEIGASALIDTINNIIPEGFKPEEQDSALVTYAAKINKSEGELDFSKTKSQLVFDFKGLQPWPGSYFFYNSDLIKVHAMYATEYEDIIEPGTIVSWNKDGLVIAAIDGCVVLTSLQFPGKKALMTKDIFNSKPDYFRVGTKLAKK